jgi:hypothetical protein
MPLTSAQKQARYRERHLGVRRDQGARPIPSHQSALIRLAHHKKSTVTALIEELAARTERGVTARL